MNVNLVHLKSNLPQRFKMLMAMHRDWIPRTARGYSWRLMLNQAGENALGGVVWPKPIKAHVLHVEDEIVVTKQAGSRTEFALTALSLFRPEDREYIKPGATLVFQQYCPREMDGTALQPMRLVSSNDYGTHSTKTHVMNLQGTTEHGLSAQGEYMQQLLEQITHLKSGPRTIVQMLLDAGAVDWKVNEPMDDEEVLDSPPALSARLTRGDVQGNFYIIYERASDTYNVQLVRDENHAPLIAYEQVHFDELADRVKSIVGDECLRFIAIELVKKAPSNPALTAYAATVRTADQALMAA